MSKSKRNTYIDQIRDNKHKTPGPGSYLNKEREKKYREEYMDKVPLGRLNTAATVNFVDTCEFYGNEVPGPGHYMPKP